MTFLQLDGARGCILACLWDNFTTRRAYVTHRNIYEVQGFLRAAIDRPLILGSRITEGPN